MVAKVNSGKSIRGVLNYNENKVKAGVARCLHENLFGQSVDNLSFSNKLKGFENLIARNRRVTTNTVHISLNFHAEDNLSSNKLIDIATAYMERIGFGSQPYLVYEHTDAAHPHVHIITTNIKRSGKRITLFNIGRNQSARAREQLEKEFNLIQASGRKPQPHARIRTEDLVQYGKVETKRAIANRVYYVTRSHCYTSMAELNAVLGQYRVYADRGSEQSQMFKRNGLIYGLLNAQGKKVGVPIKASALHSKPMLKYLEKQFVLNAVLRQPHKERLKQCIDAALHKLAQSSGKAGGEVAFKRLLRAENINVVFQKNDAGRLYGLTFIDNSTKVVFKGSDLGKAFGAGAIAPQLVALSPATVNAPSGSGTLEVLPLKDLQQLVVDMTHADEMNQVSPEAALRLRKKRKRPKRK
ncbi:MAG: relaxase/mobilization nuclease domain-containing protein [Cytophagales bacterium]|nr:relaxase/mobilization nuclease domain-containing protein [Cytophagales bacterium]